MKVESEEHEHANKQANIPASTDGMFACYREHTQRHEEKFGLAPCGADRYLAAISNTALS